MRFRALLLLLAAVILGSMAAYLVNSIVTQQAAQPPVTVEQTGIPTVVAITDLSVGLALETIHLTVTELPEGAVPEGAFHRPCPGIHRRGPDSPRRDARRGGRSAEQTVHGYPDSGADHQNS